MTTTTTTSAYDRLLGLVQDASLLESTSELLGWDQETMMPEGGVEYRSRQLAQLARLSHEHATNSLIADLLDEAAGEHADPVTPEAANIREMRRDYEIATKIPADLVEALAKLSSVAMHEWAHARKTNDFAHFKPYLEQTVELCRRKADCLGVPQDGERWDALADTFEPGMRAADIAVVFKPIRERLASLVSDLMSSDTSPNNAFNEAVVPIEDQKRFTRKVAEAFGFDFERGRLDTSVHPFCGGSHCNDVRMTTRFRENEVNDALGGTMHETGHGLYEQGLPFEHVGTPLGTAISLGIHESQSRMWENQVGRSRQFWEWCAPLAREILGAPVADLSNEDFYQGANIVRPGFIRVDADEATYNLHIMIRFELERALISGDLDAGDVPGEWNRMYKDYLGLEVTEDRLGCLQDVHWSMGAIGYFPTYTLGNLYCAQLFDTACSQNPGMMDGFSEGRFAPLLDWLRENVHSHGRRYPASELCEMVTGSTLTADPLMDYLEGKLRPLYGV